MDSKEIIRIATEKTPLVKTNIVADAYRHDVIRSLKGNDNIGIELGVAGGIFSKRMVDSGKFKKFYGVDLYADHHDTEEYVRALKHVGLDVPYTLLRMSFDDALTLFDENYFDFIYFDGYAHTGEEGGKSFIDWYKKVKVGGIFAGDDYHDSWPLVKWAVNSFVKTLGVELNVTGLTETTNLSHFPSWFFTKISDAEFDGVLDKDLYELSKITKAQAEKHPMRQSKEKREAQKDLTLTLDQIFIFCEAVCKQHPEQIPVFQSIINRNSVK